MICQNCRATVDDDLIFCTNCGTRLAEAPPQTVVMTEAPAAQPVNKKAPKPASRLKWAALIVALVAIPASIFGVYLLANSPKNQTTTQNFNKPATPKPSPTRKENVNQNANVNLSNANSEPANKTNANFNANGAKPSSAIEVFNERIEIAPHSHFAKSFSVESETAVLMGKVELLEGKTYKGYVYLQTQYDEHFPDETYKMFNFGEEKKSELKSTLYKEDYVLIFLNDSDEKIVVNGNLRLE